MNDTIAADSLTIYPRQALPEKWFYQIIAFLRINHTEGFVGENQFRNQISPAAYHPVSIVLGRGDVLIAHTEVLWKTITHHEQDYIIYGLSGVLVYPAFQGQGYGRKIVQAGTDYIRNQPNADLAIVICDAQNVAFYEKCGWQFVDNRLLLGDRSNPYHSEEKFALRFLSDRAKQHQGDFKNSPIYFGDEW
ncbi:MAG: GNAT family N-acetyltransferase [Anaerolineae bacterium]|nr:GNAT family N-acetyltransferase [Anaerolineae bacterium]